MPLSTTLARHVILGSLILAPLASASAQEPAGEIIVSVSDAPAAGAPAGEEEAYVNGYRASLSGQVILYHSAHPDAEAALIVRANSEAHSAAWETDTIPAHGPSEPVRIIWLAGLVPLYFFTAGYAKFIARKPAGSLWKYF